MSDLRIDENFGFGDDEPVATFDNVVAVKSDEIDVLRELYSDNPEPLMLLSFFRDADWAEPGEMKELAQAAMRFLELFNMDNLSDLRQFGTHLSRLRGAPDTRLITEGNFASPFAIDAAKTSCCFDLARCGWISFIRKFFECRKGSWITETYPSTTTADFNSVDTSALQIISMSLGGVSIDCSYYFRVGGFYLTGPKGNDDDMLDFNKEQTFKSLAKDHIHSLPDLSVSAKSSFYYKQLHFLMSNLRYSNKNRKFEPRTRTSPELLNDKVNAVLMKHRYYESDLTALQKALNNDITRGKIDLTTRDTLSFLEHAIKHEFLTDMKPWEVHSFDATERKFFSSIHDSLEGFDSVQSPNNQHFKTCSRAIVRYLNVCLGGSYQLKSEQLNPVRMPQFCMNLRSPKYSDPSSYSYERALIGCFNPLASTVSTAHKAYEIEDSIRGGLETGVTYHVFHVGSKPHNATHFAFCEPDVAERYRLVMADLRPDQGAGIFKHDVVTMKTPKFLRNYIYFMDAYFERDGQGRPVASNHEEHNAHNTQALEVVVKVCQDAEIYFSAKETKDELKNIHKGIFADNKGKDEAVDPNLASPVKEPDAHVIETKTVTSTKGFQSATIMKFDYNSNPFMPLFFAVKLFLPIHVLEARKTKDGISPFVRKFLGLRKYFSSYKFLFNANRPGNCEFYVILSRKQNVGTFTKFPSDEQVPSEVGKLTEFFVYRYLVRALITFYRKLLSKCYYPSFPLVRRGHKMTFTPSEVDSIGDTMAEEDSSVSFCLSGFLMKLDELDLSDEERSVQEYITLVYGVSPKTTKFAIKYFEGINHQLTPSQVRSYLRGKRFN